MPIIDLRGGSIRVDHIDFGRGVFLRTTNGNRLEIVSNDAILTLPTTTLTLATLTGTETLTNKTLTAPTISAPTFSGTAAGDLTSLTLVTPVLGVVTSGDISACTSTSMALTTPVIGAATGTSLALTGALSNGTVVTPGTGTSAAQTRDSGVWTNGSIIHTRIFVDLTDLVGSATDLDIIGNTGGAASANFGQITVAVNGTFVGGQVTCLEVPAGGADDIDFYSATVATGAQDGLVTDLVETVLVTRGAAWVAGDVKSFTAAAGPPANDYLYIVNGEAVGGTYTAGKFLIEIFGT